MLGVHSHAQPIDVVRESLKHGTIERVIQDLHLAWQVGESRDCLVRLIAQACRDRADSVWPHLLRASASVRYWIAGARQSLAASTRLVLADLRCTSALRRKLSEPAASQGARV